jgi:glycosyltransferase involved in cell wall biosynthesis
MEQPKKVLFVVDHLDYGGAQTHLVDLVNSLSKEFHPTILLLSERNALASRIKPSIEVHKEVRRWRYDFSLTKRIASYIVNGSYHNYFAISSFAFYFLCLTRKKLGHNYPINFILHSSQILNYKDHIRRSLFFRYKLPQDIFIATCQFQVKYISKICRIPLRQFQTIYNCINTNRFIPRPSSFDAIGFRQSIDVPPDAKVIVQVAMLREEKDHQSSIRALHILKKQEKEMPYLVFVGGDNDLLEYKLKIIAQELDVAAFVRFCGMQKDIRPYYWISDLFTLSSRAIETFSLSALEAMASGLPCVLTNVGGAQEMVTDGLNGFVVPPKNPQALADGWWKVLNGALTMSSYKIRKMAEEKYSLDVMMRSYEALIQ